MPNSDIAHLRLARHRIGGDRLARPGDVPRWMGALQAQDYMQAVWAIGVRTRSATLADVERAIEAGKIIRTWPMRGTIHFVPPEDVRWMQRLLAARLLAADARRLAQLELTVELMGRCQDIFCRSLSGGKRLSRSDMLARLEAEGISTARQRGYHILWYAAQSGVICMGPMQGKEQTFVLLDDWVPPGRDLAREEALAELARRYYASHGPATLHDFAWWAGITVREARLGLEAAKTGLVAREIAGTTYWMSEEGLSPAGDGTATVHLLPGFDEYLLGYKERGAIIAGEHAQRIVPGNNGIFLPMIVVDGQVVGTWKRSVKKKGIEIVLQPFVPLADFVDQAVEAARAYAAFLDLPPTVRVSDPAG